MFCAITNYCMILLLICVIVSESYAVCSEVLTLGWSTLQQKKYKLLNLNGAPFYIVLHMKKDVHAKFCNTCLKF